MMVRSLILWVTGGLILLIGCGPGVGEGPDWTSSKNATRHETDDDDKDTDSSNGRFIDTDSDTRGDTGSASDSDNIQVDTDPVWCSDLLFQPKIVFEASDLLPGGSFVSMGDDCVLLAAPEPDGQTRMKVVFMDAASEDIAVAAVEGVFDARPIDHTCHYDASLAEYSAVVLMETDDDTRIAVADAATGQWQERFTGPRLKGINYLFRTKEPRQDYVCAFGEGLYCSDRESGWTEWREEIAPSIGAELNDITLYYRNETWCRVAVGPAGAIWVDPGDGWRKTEAVTDMDLLTVGSADDYFTAAGQAGTIVHGNGEEGTVFTLPQVGDIISLFWQSTQIFKGITADGTVFEGTIHNGILHRCPEMFELSESVIDGIYHTCESELELLILKADVLVGGYDCSSIVVV